MYSIGFSYMHMRRSRPHAVWCRHIPTSRPLPRRAVCLHTCHGTRHSIPRLSSLSLSRGDAESGCEEGGRSEFILGRDLDTPPPPFLSATLFLQTTSPAHAASHTEEKCGDAACCIQAQPRGCLPCLVLRLWARRRARQGGPIGPAGPSLIASLVLYSL
ncbi:hypothetical protein GQ53DRAFT_137177 [Thozetella sp. PMI_491]|nr:hypothetical protein GQ53DRAFT_137177 [Thozetella sp. PMI_491]